MLNVQDTVVAPAVNEIDCGSPRSFGSVDVNVMFTGVAAVLFQYASVARI